MNKRYLAIFSALAALLFATLACQALSSGVPTQTPSNVLFQDDFSNPNSGWNRITEADGQTDYISGTYRIFVNTAGTDVWANPGLSFQDVRIEVDATKVGGSDNNNFGLTCRTLDGDHYYFFYISSDGYYGIGKVNGDNQSLIGMEVLQPSDKIHRGSATNHLRADCSGSTLALYVNGAKLAEGQDSEYTSGDVGLVAGTYDTPGTDIRFDNFSVLRP
jgi:hypothetical protein